MARSLTHIGSGSHYGRGRKYGRRMHWTRAHIAVTLGFLIAVVVIVMVGMYFGWLSSQEEQTNSPVTKVSAPQK